MRKVAIIAVLLLSLPAPAWAAKKPKPTKPTQTAPRAAPQAAPPAPTQIPLSTEPSAPKKKTKAEKDRQYAFLVIGCALLPIAAFMFWKFWPRTQRRRYQPYRYSAGPADPRRMRRRNKR